MNTDMPAPGPPSGWVFYDGRCPLCLALVGRGGPMFRRRGFDFAPLQNDWVASRLGLDSGELPGEMKLLLPAGGLIGGVDALRALGRRVFWLRPLAEISRWPGINAAAWAAYRWIAANRHCFGDLCGVPARRREHPRATTFFESP